MPWPCASWWWHLMVQGAKYEGHWRGLAGLHESQFSQLAVDHWSQSMQLLVSRQALINLMTAGQVHVGLLRLYRWTQCTGAGLQTSSLWYFQRPATSLALAWQCTVCLNWLCWIYQSLVFNGTTQSCIPLSQPRVLDLQATTWYGRAILLSASSGLIQNILRHPCYTYVLNYGSLLLLMFLFYFYLSLFRLCTVKPSVCFESVQYLLPWMVAKVKQRVGI